jgi:hypothetical protein
VNVDFTLLDFLPQGFAKEVAMMIPYKGHKTATSQLVDSLYYSLDFNQTEIGENAPPYYGVKTKGMRISNTLDLSHYFRKKEKPQHSICGIDPLSIKTIKTAPYANTFLATREFESRVRALHSIKNGNELVQLYVSNLAKNLSTVDSMIARTLTGADKLKFDAFAKEGLTNIKDAAIYQDQLSAYYSKKKKEYTTAQNAIRKELSKKNKAALSQLNTAYKNAGGSIQTQNNIPGVSALAKLMPNATAATSNVYAFQWSSPGWVNIDAYLHLLDKGAEEVEMIVKSAAGTTEVYQWLNTINNLTPLLINGETAIAAFPERNKPGANQMMGITNGLICDTTRMKRKN